MSRRGDTVVLCMVVVLPVVVMRCARVVNYSGSISCGIDIQYGKNENVYGIWICVVLCCVVLCWVGLGSMYVIHIYVYGNVITVLYVALHWFVVHNNIIHSNYTFDGTQSRQVFAGTSQTLL